MQVHHHYQQHQQVLFDLIYWLIFRLSINLDSKNNNNNRNNNNEYLSDCEPIIIQLNGLINNYPQCSFYNETTKLFENNS